MDLVEFKLYVKQLGQVFLHTKESSNVVRMCASLTSKLKTFQAGELSSWGDLSWRARTLNLAAERGLT